MNRAKQIICLGMLFLSSGCLNPQNTTLPDLNPRHPETELRSYERFDPFTLGDMGPETFTRQRDFSQPRTAPTRAKTGASIPPTFGAPAPATAVPVNPYFNSPAQPGLSPAPGFQPPVQNP